MSAIERRNLSSAVEIFLADITSNTCWSQKTPILNNRKIFTCIFLILLVVMRPSQPQCISTTALETTCHATQYEHVRNYTVNVIESSNFWVYWLAEYELLPNMGLRILNLKHWGPDTHKPRPIDCKSCKKKICRFTDKQKTNNQQCTFCTQWFCLRTSI